jgi:hypothetical protein
MLAQNLPAPRFAGPLRSVRPLRTAGHFQFSRMHRRGRLTRPVAPVGVFRSSASALSLSLFIRLSNWPSLPRMLLSFALLTTPYVLLVHASAVPCRKAHGRERLGTSLTEPVFVSVPQVVDTGIPSLQISGNNPRDGTNYTLAAPFTPAGGDQQRRPTCELCGGGTRATPRPTR